MSKRDPRGVVRRRMERNREVGRRVNQALLDYEAERTVIYVAGRELDPPMTYKEIAAVYGITEAAVMQKVKRFYEDHPALTM